MLTRRLALLAAILTVLGPALPASASSLPHADFGSVPLLGIGLGGDSAYQAGGSLSLDVPVGESVLLGGAVGSTLGGGFNFDLRGAYRFVQGETGAGPSIAAIVGVWEQPGFNAIENTLGASPFLGFGLSYPFNDRFTARLDLAYAPFYNYASFSPFLGFLGGPPGSGLELGYKVTKNVEATLGLNGRGDFLGATIGI